MTLKELLDKVDFDRLVPFIEKTEGKHLDSIYGFREAYDILRHMEPTEDFKGEALVEWSGEEYGDDRWIGVFHLDGDYWEDALAKEIVIGENVDLSIEEIAAKCLWEITFYGFTPEHERFEDILGCKLRNKYDLMLDRLEESEWRHQIPRKYRIRRNGQRLISGDWGMQNWSGKRMNRPKRMREHRQKTREKYLKSMSRRENNIQDLTVEGSSFTRVNLDFVLAVEYGVRYDFRSVTGPYRQSDSNSEVTAESCAVAVQETPTSYSQTCDKRLDYILESITKYQHLDLSRYDNVVMCVCYSSKYSVSDGKLAEFYANIREHFGYGDIHTGSIVTNSCEREVKAVLLLNKL